MKKWKGVGTAIVVLYGLLRFAASIENKREKEIDIDNPYITREQTFEKFDWATDSQNMCKRKHGIYKSIVKRGIDTALSLVGLIVSSPIFCVIALVIFKTDPGPIFFTQKRVGKGGHFFMLHKFRTMKINTPHDVPTHQLEDPEQYITKIGKVLRKTSLDELPQGWDIFRGRMSIIGPRPALWNQIDLVSEREKYGANDILPGLTGWAQINGRDKLKISMKASYDGEYTTVLNTGGIYAFVMDVRCFLGTIVSVIHSDGIVEGRTN